MAEKRYRNFCLMTYLTESQILAVMQKHDRQLKAYAYICHDKDKDALGQEKTKHYHLLVCLVNNTTTDAMRNWFKGYTDEKGLPVNTLAQPMHDINGSYDYLRHDTEQAKAEGKYLYPVEDVKGFNLDFFTDVQMQETDTLTMAMNDMLEGIPLDEVRKKYGRDFIMHYGHIKLLFNDIQKQLGGKLL